MENKHYKLDKEESKKMTGYASIDKPWLLEKKLRCNELLQKFKEEIENIQTRPCLEPYELDGYDSKNRLILEEIDKNRNHSWIKEIYERRKDELDNIAIVYRGHKFTYSDFFTQSYKYAKALKQYGVKKGDEFVCCIENVPEFPFIMGAASILGAKVNLLAADMDQDYLCDIINDANSPLIFVSDKNLEEFTPVLKRVMQYKKIIPIPLEYSIDNNEFSFITEQFYKLDNEKYNKCLSELDNVVDLDTFLQQGDNYNGPLFENTGLNDGFTVTYTSGSTLSNKPKGLEHGNRSYITMGRYHDPEISHIPSMKGMTMLAFVRTMSDTDFMSAISDVFMQGGNVALEPINDKDFIMWSMIINKANICLTSRTVWLYNMKKQMSDSAYANFKFPDLIAPMCIGEPEEENEDKALNKWFKKMKAGTRITKTPFSIVCMSIAGGDSEHGGIFITMYRALQKLRLKNLGIKGQIGMGTYGMVKIAALKEDMSLCDFDEPGKLVAKSPCTMHGYRKNPEENKEFFIKDKYGNAWENLNTYGWVDKNKYVHVKGRISKTDGEIPNYAIATEILKDTKKIMSCEVVNSSINGQTVYVAHIEQQFQVPFNSEKVLKSAAQRCKNKFGEEILDKLYFRVRSSEESFPLTATLKRSFNDLIKEGVSDKCVLAKSFIYNKKSSKQKILK